MVKIPLIGSNLPATIDDDDASIVTVYNDWRILKGSHTNYVYRIKDASIVYMHTLITGFRFTDHKNGDGLDNRRQNLRECSRHTNNMNARKISPATSIYKGVSWKADHQKWRAQIAVNNKRIFLGYYDQEIDAALAYDKVARQYFGDFATLNFPKVGERGAVE